MGERTWKACLNLSNVPAWAVSHLNRRRTAKSAPQDPFIVVEAGHVVGVSRSPRRHGVEVGMTSSRAISLCEHANIYPRDVGLEKALWEHTLEDLNRQTPRIESSSVGTAWFEPIPNSNLQNWLRGTTFRVGIARSRSTARLAAWKASKGRYICIQDPYQDQFLSRVPVRALASIGFSDELVDRLVLFGYDTVQAVHGLTKRHLDAQFGEEGQRLYRFLASDEGRVSFYSPPPSIEATRDIERPGAEMGTLQSVIADCAEALEDQLRGRAGQHLVLTLRGRGQEGTASRIMREPRSRAEQLRRTAGRLLKELFSPDLCVRSLQIELRALCTQEKKQADLFFQRPEVKRAVSAVERRFPDAIVRSVRDEHAVFPEQRFRYEPVSLEL